MWSILQHVTIGDKENYFGEKLCVGEKDQLNPRNYQDTTKGLREEAEIIYGRERLFEPKKIPRHY